VPNLRKSVGTDYVSGWAQENIYLATICTPTGSIDCVLPVGISQPSVMLIFELVFWGSKCGISPEPELIDKLKTLGVASQFLKRRPLFIRDDVSYVLLKPVSPIGI